MASRMRGGRSFQRLLRGMPAAMRVELADVLQRSAPAIERTVRGRIAATTRRKSGRLIGGVKSKVYPATLRLRVGFLGTPRGQSKLFYARILDVGRRAQTVFVRRFRKGAARTYNRSGHKIGNLITYRMKVRAIAPKRFVTGSYTSMRQIVGDRLRNVFNRALGRVPGGSGND